jgi:hypothetical protein
MTSDHFCAFMKALQAASGAKRPLQMLSAEGQSATELSGGEAQRVKLATELQRTQRGGTLYVLDEPTTGMHPSDVAKLMNQLDGISSARGTASMQHDVVPLLDKEFSGHLSEPVGRAGNENTRDSQILRLLDDRRGIGLWRRRTSIYRSTLSKRRYAKAWHRQQAYCAIFPNRDRSALERGGCSVCRDLPRHIRQRPVR